MSGGSCFSEVVSRLDQIGLGEEYNLYADWSRDDKGFTPLDTVPGMGKQAMEKQTVETINGPLVDAESGKAHWKDECHDPDGIVGPGIRKMNKMDYQSSRPVRQWLRHFVK